MVTRNRKVLKQNQEIKNGVPILLVIMCCGNGQWAWPRQGPLHTGLPLPEYFRVSNATPWLKH